MEKDLKQYVAEVQLRHREVFGWVNAFNVWNEHIAADRLQESWAGVLGYAMEIHEESYYPDFYQLTIELEPLSGGRVLCWHSNGNVSLEGWISRGEEVGEWRRYGVLGELFSVETNLSNHERSLIEYHLNGKIAKKEHYLEGNRHGDFLTFYPNGIIAKSTHYEIGRKVNESHFNKQGELEWKETVEKVGRYVSSRKNPETGMEQRNFENGIVHRTEHYYTSGKLEKICEYVVEDGIAYAYNFVSLKRLFYFGNGNISKSILYNDPEDVEYTEEFFLHGQIRQRMFFQNWHLHGLFEEWFENGNKKLELMWDGGLRNGPYTSFYPNGNKREEGRYDQDKLDGVIARYSESGTLLSRVTYAHGKRHGMYERNAPDGEIIHRGTYRFINRYILSDWNYKAGVVVSFELPLSFDEGEYIPPKVNVRLVKTIFYAIMLVLLLYFLWFVYQIGK